MRWCRLAATLGLVAAPPGRAGAPHGLAPPRILLMAPCAIESSMLFPNTRRTGSALPAREFDQHDVGVLPYALEQHALAVRRHIEAME